MKNKQDLNIYSDEIRKVSCKMFLARGDGHVGGSFSIIESLAVIFNNHMGKEDWFVLSKGHAGPAYYSVLYLEGFLNDEDIYTLNENGTNIPSHPDRMKTPGVQVTTGSLGQGISQAVGIAYGLKIQSKKGYVYVIVGDGEFQEGQVYEAIQFASKNKLDNLFIFIDNNKKQVDGLVKDIGGDIDYKTFFKSFNIESKIVDGHDVSEIDKEIFDGKKRKNSVNIIILNTIKGHGIKYFENHINPHHLEFNENEINVLKNYIAQKEEIVNEMGN